MKISIITSVYNNKNSVVQAIESVLNQTYHNIEYIVVDGLSTDGTVDIIKSFKDKIDIFVSESDRGIYDGLNKGIELATGDIIGFLHSDDFYVDNYAIENIMKIFDKNDCDGVYGDLIYVDKKNINKVIRYWKSGEFKYKNLKRGWMPPHPAFFIKKKIYNKFGYFDTNFKIAADYDFMLKILIYKKIQVRYLPKIIYAMRVGGESNKNLGNLWQKSKEDLVALHNNKIGGFLTLLEKNLFKICQFFIKKDDLNLEISFLK